MLKYCSVIIIIFILILIYLVNNEREKITNIKIKENFVNKKSNSNNLINNGSFKNKKHIQEYHESQGTSIIEKQNPGDSNNVLEQKCSNNNIYYGIKINLKKNNTYKINCWYAVTSEWNGSDNLINILINYTDNKNDTVTGNEKIVQTLNIDNLIWYNIETTFKVKNKDVKNAIIYFGYNPNGSKGTRYITSIKMDIHNETTSLFPFNNILNLLLRANDRKSYSKDGSLVWNDLSKNKFKFKWIHRPEWIEPKYLSTIDNKAYGPSSNNLIKNSNNFTLLIQFKINDDNNNKYHELISFDGNQNTSLSVNLSNNHNLLNILVSDKLYKIPVKILPENDILLTLINNNNKMEIWVGLKKIKTINIDKIHFSGETIINPSKLLNAKLSSIIILNKNIGKDDIQKISLYLNKDITNDIQYIFDDPLKGKYNNFIYEKKPNDTNTFIKNKNINKTNLVGQRCHEKCIGNCQSHLDDSELAKCIRSCKHTINECSNYCSYIDNKSDYICKNLSNHSPNVYHKNNAYHVYIPKESKYSSNYGHGEKNYGNNRLKAKYIYEQNFPDEETPKILIHGPQNNTKHKCPFIINNKNPCFEEHCNNIEWNKPLSKNKINKKCKNNISHYCELNNEYDEACKCWHEEYKNHPNCIKHRELFNTEENKCNINLFNIKEHPDYKNYIRKDKIPCWNCNLDN